VSLGKTPTTSKEKAAVTAAPTPTPSPVPVTLAAFALPRPVVKTALVVSSSSKSPSVTQKKEGIDIVERATVPRLVHDINAELTQLASLARSIKDCKEMSTDFLWLSTDYQSRFKGCKSYEEMATCLSSLSVDYMTLKASEANYKKDSDDYYVRPIPNNIKRKLEDLLAPPPLFKEVVALASLPFPRLHRHLMVRVAGELSLDAARRYKQQKGHLATGREQKDAGTILSRQYEAGIIFFLISLKSFKNIYDPFLVCRHYVALQELLSRPIIQLSPALGLQARDQYTSLLERERALYKGLRVEIQNSVIPQKAKSVSCVLWAQIILLISNGRANESNPMRNSIKQLLPAILEFAFPRQPQPGVKSESPARVVKGPTPASQPTPISDVVYTCCRLIERQEPDPAEVCDAVDELKLLVTGNSPSASLFYETYVVIENNYFVQRARSIVARCYSNREDIPAPTTATLPPATPAVIAVQSLDEDTEGKTLTTSAKALVATVSVGSAVVAAEQKHVVDGKEEDAQRPLPEAPELSPSVTTPAAAPAVPRT
jgi:hypothetical protein